MRSWAVLIATGLCGWLTTGSPAAACTTGLTEVDGGGTCLAAETFGAEAAGSAPELIVVLHGDVSRGGPADYHLKLARELSEDGAVAVALVRPGYPGPAGRRSEGSNNDRRDHYTDENNRIVGAAIQALRAFHGADRVIAVGHSGGAAQVGAIIGKLPDAIDVAILVSCPCDIDEWRRSRNRRPWRNSESPSDYVDAVPVTTQVLTLTGAQDSNTREFLARNYVEDLASRGVSAEHLTVRGAGHSMDRTLRQAVSEAVSRLR